MLDLIVAIVFGVIFFKVAGITLRLAWGVTKIIAGILMLLALPALVVCILFASGIVLFAPIFLLGAAFAVAKAS